MVGAQNHPLVNQLHEWFRRWHVAQIVQNLVPEAGIQQVQDGMFSPPDVQIDW